MSEQTTDVPPADGPESNEIATADKTYRAVIFVVYGLIVVFGFITYRYLIPFGLSYLRSLGWKQLLQTLRLVFILLLLSFSPAAVYVIVIGRRILRHDCWPYPGRKVMFDTKVLHGKQAQSRGRLMIALGTVFLVLMVISVTYVYVRYTGWLRSPLLKKYLFHESAVWHRPGAVGCGRTASASTPRAEQCRERAISGASFMDASRRIFTETSEYARAGPSGTDC
ncbi:MAG: hypothetical protein GF331_23555 [Chitinivibrionales bacterium]|nr:hypothetical protein [Chitinivibrionales bacterium]